MALCVYMLETVPYGKWLVIMVNIDENKKYWKSTAENDFSLFPPDWLISNIFVLSCGGGDKGIEGPCTHSHDPKNRDTKLTHYFRAYGWTFSLKNIF